MYKTGISSTLAMEITQPYAKVWIYELIDLNWMKFDHIDPISVWHCMCTVRCVVGTHEKLEAEYQTLEKYSGR